MQKKSFIIVIIAVAILVIYMISSYNKIIKSEVGVSQEWSNVETQYQRRADLIDNLVATVKGYAQHEKTTLTEVIAARATASQTKIDATNLTAENLQAFQASQGELSSALSRLLVTVERYPELKANQNFSELQAQLEGTENRIQVARQRYNDVASDYNKYIQIFPTNIIARIFGFNTKPFFSSEKGSEKVPQVQF